MALFKVTKRVVLLNQFVKIFNNKGMSMLFFYSPHFSGKVRDPTKTKTQIHSNVMLATACLMVGATYKGCFHPETTQQVQSHGAFAGDITTFGWVPWQGLSHFAGGVDSAELEKKMDRSSLCQKRLKVAIVGRPNAGKSTLINKILNLNICDVSPKTHTTRRPLKTAFTQGDTQIVFVDTPGLVTKKECSRFELSDAFRSWKENVFQEVDIVGVIHEVTSPKDIFKLHINLVQSLKDLNEAKSMFIILNKIDQVIDKAGLSEAIAAVTKPTEANGKPSDLWNKFSRVFLISALKNVGVQEVVSFLIEQARPGDWLYQPSVVCNKPLHVLLTDLLRAQVMQILPNEVPYKCSFQVEYMKENDLGEVICVALIRCKKKRHLKILVEKRKGALRELAKKLESDLYKIIGKVFRLRIVAVSA